MVQRVRQQFDYNCSALQRSAPQARHHDADCQRACQTCCACEIVTSIRQDTVRSSRPDICNRRYAISPADTIASSTGFCCGGRGRFKRVRERICTCQFRTRWSIFAGVCTWQPYDSVPMRMLQTPTALSTPSERSSVRQPLPRKSSTFTPVNSATRYSAAQKLLVVEWHQQSTFTLARTVEAFAASNSRAPFSYATLTKWIAKKGRLLVDAAKPSTSSETLLPLHFPPLKRSSVTNSDGSYSVPGRSQDVSRTEVWQLAMHFLCYGAERNVFRVMYRSLPSTRVQKYRSSTHIVAAT